LSIAIALETLSSSRELTSKESKEKKLLQKNTTQLPTTNRMMSKQKVISSLTPKGPRPFFCKKTLKTTISIAKSKKI